MRTNPLTTFNITTHSATETEAIAEKLARNLRGGEVIELESDLGGGKTTFVHGLARGLGSHDHVSSPTFKISNVYTGTHFKLYHFDFYRLTEAGLIAHELADASDDQTNIIVIEWGDTVKDVLPAERLSVRLSPIADTSRQLAFTLPSGLDYLQESLQ